MSNVLRQNGASMAQLLADADSGANQNKRNSLIDNKDYQQESLGINAIGTQL
jgi:hypothetical protein